MPRATALSRASTAFGPLRWLFMPLGLFALVAVGVHAAADLVDDRLLLLVEWLDASIDVVLAASDGTAGWVDKVGVHECTLIARSLALAWELAVDALIAVPALGYFEATDAEANLAAATPHQVGTWWALFRRVNQAPTAMRVLRPLVTAAFVVAGAYAVSRLVESTFFVALQGGVASPEAAAVIARVLGGLALGVVLFTHGGRAVLRALQHADARCDEALRAKKSPHAVGLVGSALALPLALALALEARSLLSLFL